MNAMFGVVPLKTLIFTIFWGSYTGIPRLRKQDTPKMPLTDRAVINLKPKPKPYKKYDSGGLHLYVSPSGGKL